MKLGFTGTQKGMTHAQFTALETMLDPTVHTQFHHGDCQGADWEAARLAEILKIPTHSHPCDIPHKRAHHKSTVVYSVKPPLVRNHDIVRACSLLIACPKEFKEITRSGTWATIRNALKSGRRLVIIYPDGKLETHSGK